MWIYLWYLCNWKCSILLVTSECWRALIDVSFVVFVSVEMFKSCGNWGLLEEVTRVHAVIE